MRARPRVTIRDLEHTPEDGNRYEIIDGELYVSKQPDIQHQFTCDEVVSQLRAWSRATGAGIAVSAPGIVFADNEAVAPDVVWISRARYRSIIGGDGKLHAAPDLVVEVLSPGATNTTRDRELKLELYSRRGVLEYWIINWAECSVLVYRREGNALHLAASLWTEDTLTSPTLPGFATTVRDLGASPV